MCGIHGILAFSPDHYPNEKELQPMADCAVHRGPDDHGSYVNHEIALGQTRLSIIGLSTGHQPITNEDSSIWLACNGEIYNFRELRRKLEQNGHRFRTESDSEVILHLYEEQGQDLVNQLDGMFAFALWDSRQRRLLLARDRLGIKPLYYIQNDKRLLFASEAKALLSLPGINAEIDKSSLQEYLALGYVSAPRSLFNGIAKLPAASLLTAQKGKTELRQYWRLPTETRHDLNESQWAEAIHDQLKQSVASHLVSDVPLGAFLSGGIDSSAIVALMAGMTEQPIKTYAIGFDDTSGGGSYYNELSYARQVAKRYGTDHREIVVRPDTVRLLPKLIWHLDEPIADSAFITTFLVSEFARQDVTVILSGVGGDELFGGYRRYQGEYYGNYYKRLPQWLRTGVLAPLARKLPSDRHSPMLNLFRYFRSFILSAELPFEERYRAYVQAFSHPQLEALLLDPLPRLRDGLDRAFERSVAKDPLHRLVEVDFDTQLPDDLLMLTDRMSMATSLECRVPFLDHHLVELAAQMPSRLKIHGRELKYILKLALKDLLPHEILYRKKRGFGAPMGAWINDELAPFLDQLLSRSSVERRGLFHWPQIERVIALHRARKEDHTDHLLALINLEIWARIYLDNRSPDDVGEELLAEIRP